MVRASARVRPAEPRDVDALVDLTRSLDGSRRGEPDPEHLRDRLTEILAEGHRTFLVAEDELAHAVVGLLVARQEDVGAIDVVPAVHVSHLIVSPKQRRRGVGRALLCAVVSQAGEAGVDRVIVDVAAGSRESNRYLARLGFAPLVVHRVASTATLRRALGMAEDSERMAVLRRARLIRAQRAGIRTAAAPRIAHRGA